MTHTLTIPNWQPTRTNTLMNCHWATRARFKRNDAALVTVASHEAGIPVATGKRRVGLHLTLGPRQRAADPDAYWKSLLDALVHAGLLVDDNRQNVELSPVTFGRGHARATTITLEDLK